MNTLGGDTLGGGTRLAAGRSSSDPDQGGELLSSPKLEGEEGGARSTGNLSTPRLKIGTGNLVIWLFSVVTPAKPCPRPPSSNKAYNLKNSSLNSASSIDKKEVCNEWIESLEAFNCHVL